MIDKDSIKKQITIDQIEYILEYFGGEPNIEKSNVLVSLTIDHNPAHEGSRKLYYYDNEEGGLFRSYTGDINTFDIFELIIKIYDIQFDEKLELPAAIRIVCTLLNIPLLDDEDNNFNEFNAIQDYLSDLKRYSKLQKVADKKRLEFKVYEDKILKNLPQPVIVPWLEEGITREVMKNAGIRFNPVSQAIVIPFYDDNENLIGIRERTLIKENEEIYGKYRPSYINGKMYNHALGLSLYGLDKSKDNISKIKKAIILEGEKSVLKYRSLFGEENDISVASCGSAISAQQVELLRKYGVEEIIVAFDRDYEIKGDDTFKKQVRNFKAMNKKFSSIVKISFMWDKNGNLLNPHESPIDRMDKDLFLKMFKDRIVL